MEAALRTAAEKLPGVEIKTAVVSGLANANQFLQQIKNGEGEGEGSEENHNEKNPRLRRK